MNMNQHNAYPDQPSEMPMPLHDAMRVVEEHLDEVGGGQWSHWSDVKMAAQNVATAKAESGGDHISRTVEQLARMHLAAVEDETRGAHRTDP